LDRLLLLLQPRLHVDGDIELARADAQLEIDFLQLLLRAAGLPAHVVEPSLEAGDLAADAVEVGVLPRLRVSGRDGHERREQRGEELISNRAMHAGPPA